MCGKWRPCSGVGCAGRGLDPTFIEIVSIFLDSSKKNFMEEDPVMSSSLFNDKIKSCKWKCKWMIIFDNKL
jgi:hypothetical protein